MKEDLEKFKEAILEGNVAKVEEFLKKHQHYDIANWTLNNNGEAALHYLANEERCEHTPHREHLARLLLRYGANIHLKDKSGATPISEACFSFATPLIQLFIENGADVKEVNDRGFTLLESPVLHGETEIVDMLLEAGASSVINAISKKGDALIHRVADTEDIDILESCIHAGAEINILDKEGRTILHLNVLYHKNEEFNKILLEHGADYLIEDKNGMTALQYAAKESFYPLIDGFINAKLSEYSVASAEEKNSILDDCVEKFKMLLLENLLLFKPAVLIQSVPPLNEQIHYLSNRWDSIKQEVHAMKDKKIGASDYSLYDTLKTITLFSNEKVLASINEDTLKRFPHFSNRIEAAKNCVKKSETPSLGMASRMFKLPTVENLIDLSLLNISEEGKAFRPA